MMDTDDDSATSAVDDEDTDHNDDMHALLERGKSIPRSSVTVELTNDASIEEEALVTRFVEKRMLIAAYQPPFTRFDNPLGDQAPPLV